MSGERDLDFSHDAAVKKAAELGLDIIYGDSNTLLLDLDNQAAIDRFRDTFQFVSSRFPVDRVQSWRSKSNKPDRIHVVVTLEDELPLMERLLLQQVLGSDPKREVFCLLRVHSGNDVPNLLFRPKDATIFQGLGNLPTEPEDL